MLLLFKKKTIIRRLSRQVAYGVHDLLRTNAVNIHSNEDWSNIFTILQVYGAGGDTPIVISLMTGDKQKQQLSRTVSLKDQKLVSPRSSLAIDKYYSNENLNECCVSEPLTDRGYTSDSELYQQSLDSCQLSSHVESSSTAISETQVNTFLK